MGSAASILKLANESRASLRPNGSDGLILCDVWSRTQHPDISQRKEEAVGGKLPWLGYHPLLQELGQVPEPEDPRHFRTGRGGAGC